MPGCATGGARWRRGGPIRDAKVAADDATEADVNAVWLLAAPPKLSRGRSDATVVLVVRVTAPRHLGGIMGGKPGKRLGWETSPGMELAAVAPPLGWDADDTADTETDSWVASSRRDTGENPPDAVPKKSAPEPVTVEFADAAVVTGGSAAVVRGDDGVTKSPPLISLAILQVD